MMDYRNTMIVGVLMYGALALALIGAAGITQHDKATVLLAVASCGAAYGAQWAGAEYQSRLNAIFTWLAIFLGVAAFARLLVA